MLHIYHADSSWFREKFELKELLKQLPKSFHERALRYKFDRDTFNFILGKLMLKKGLENLGLDNDLEKIFFNKNGKPLLGNVFFNISHSGNLAVCALSRAGEIGIDVEMEKEIDLSNFENWFTKTEWKDILEHPIPLKRFYWYWVRKESIIKALGVNLSHLNQIEIDTTHDFFQEKNRSSKLEDKKWFLRDLDFGERTFGALCSATEIKELKMYGFEI